MNLKRYSKAITAAAGALSVALSDGILDLNEGITIVLAVLTAIGVYVVPNQPEKPAPASVPGDWV